MAAVAVVGPGAVGCTVLAWLAQHAGHRVTVVARSAIEDVEVQTPQGLLRASPTLVSNASELRGQDWVLVATKAYDAPTVAQSLAGLAGSATRLAILQNGVEHLEPFAAHFPAGQLLPVVVDIPALRTAPGRAIQHRRGRLRVPEGAMGAGFVALFANTGIDVSESPDFQTEAWKKLCLNAAGAFSAVLLKPAVIARHAGVAMLMGRLISEAIEVARAEGAVIDDALQDAILDGYRANPAGVNSLHADRLAGRAMEIDARNGVIVRLGRKHGIPTPMNEMVVALLEASLMGVG
ncbi:2-dehydropantoate 2-reductase [Pelomonas sp. Root1444]|nr:2-dehydropantoate 2-reductase [Pelomonas sp. Root1444]KQY85503.1 2-dehydropantoate 2-reductase [Pelomonas sp. Root1444]